jgi:hypothetical protein
MGRHRSRHHARTTSGGTCGLTAAPRERGATLDLPRSEAGLGDTRIPNPLTRPWPCGPDLRLLLRLPLNRRAGAGVLGSAAGGPPAKIIDRSAGIDLMAWIAAPWRYPQRFRPVSPPAAAPWTASPRDDRSGTLAAEAATGQRGTHAPPPSLPAPVRWPHPGRSDGPARSECARRSATAPLSPNPRMPPRRPGRGATIGPTGPRDRGRRRGAGPASARGWANADQSRLAVLLQTL